MNINLQRLYSTGKKDSRIIIGLMSGTSLDGLDVALCEIAGSGNHTKLCVKKFETINYDDDYRNELKTISFKPIISTEKLCLLNEKIGIKHAAIVNECLQKWNITREQVDLIASHGQTIYHAPKHVHRDEKVAGATLQIGDGDHLAWHTGIITISDFRQKQIAAGGDGAPLAVYGDFILFSENNYDNILLNIGGISNFTFLPAGAAFDKTICSDIGPGNTLMDAWMQKNFPGTYFDKNAVIAKQGIVHEDLLAILKEDDFFNLSFPKTTGPELFNLNYLENALAKTNRVNIPVADVMTTLNQFTASVVADAIIKATAGSKNYRVFVSGGGMHNPLLIARITNNVPGILFQSTTEKNIDPDAKEAVLFAILANETVAGNVSHFEGNKYFPAISMGKISFPG